MPAVQLTDRLRRAAAAAAEAAVLVALVGHTMRGDVGSGVMRVQAPGIDLEIAVTVRPYETQDAPKRLGPPNAGWDVVG